MNWTTSILIFILGSLFTTFLNYFFGRRRLQFRRADRKKAEVIEKLYKKLDETHRSFSSLMDFLQEANEDPIEEKGKRAAEAANDFLEFFNQNRIYLDKELEEKLEDIDSKFKEAWVKFKYARVVGDDIDVQKWKEAYESMKNDIPEAKDKIKEDFRKVIGVKSNNIWRKIRENCGF